MGEEVRREADTGEEVKGGDWVGASQRHSKGASRSRVRKRMRMRMESSDASRYAAGRSQRLQKDWSEASVIRTRGVEVHGRRAVWSLGGSAGVDWEQTRSCPLPTRALTVFGVPGQHK